MSVLPSPSYRAFNAEAGPSSYASSSPHASPLYMSPHYSSCTPSQYANAEAGPSTYRTPSASPSQASLGTHREQKRASRPLPRIPLPPTPTTPIPSPTDRLSYIRPLPTPPLRSDTPSPIPSCPSPVRPLPVPGSSASHQNIPTSALLRPTLSLRVDTPGMDTTKIVLDTLTPLEPLSPVVFCAAQESPTEMEEHVAKRLSTLGFVEVDRPRPLSDPHPTPLRVAGLRTPCSSAEEVWRSTDSCESERREDVEIRVELVSEDASEPRTSRLWIFEKKGKRRVERNYNEILHQLRKL